MSERVAAKTSGGRTGSRASAEAPDLDALLVALVLAPSTFSRNRFFEMYCDPAAYRVRRRASTLRAMARDLTRAARDKLSFSIALEEAGEAGGPRGCSTLTYAVPEIGYRRQARLDAIELAVLRYVLSRAGLAGPELPVLALAEGDRERVERALARLAPTLPSTDAAE